MNARQVVDVAKDWFSWSVEVTGTRPHHEHPADGRKEEEEDDDDVSCVITTRIPCRHRHTFLLLRRHISDISTRPISITSSLDDVVN